MLCLSAQDSVSLMFRIVHCFATTTSSAAARSREFEAGSTSFTSAAGGSGDALPRRGSGLDWQQQGLDDGDLFVAVDDDEAGAQQRRQQQDRRWQPSRQSQERARTTDAGRQQSLLRFIVHPLVPHEVGSRQEEGHAGGGDGLEEQESTSWKRVTEWLNGRSMCLWNFVVRL